MLWASIGLIAYVYALSQSTTWVCEYFRIGYRSLPDI